MKIGKWTIVRPDKKIIKQYDEQIAHTISDDNFWSTNLNSNVHAIQYTGDNTDFNQVEFNDKTPNTYFSMDIKIFADAWDKEHLKNLQFIWDSDNLKINLGKIDPSKPDQDQFRDETADEKILRIGNRPTSYVSKNIY